MNDAKIGRQHVENQKEKVSTQPMKAERENLKTMAIFRTLIFETAEKINGQVDKAKMNLDDLNYILRIGELGHLLEEYSLKFFESWMDTDDAIREQLHKASSTGSIRSEGGRG